MILLYHPLTTPAFLTLSNFHSVYIFRNEIHSSAPVYIHVLARVCHRGQYGYFAVVTGRYSSMNGDYFKTTMLGFKPSQNLLTQNVKSYCKLLLDKS